jgi:hypothetical protein
VIVLSHEETLSRMYVRLSLTSRYIYQRLTFPLTRRVQEALTRRVQEEDRHGSKMAAMKVRKFVVNSNITVSHTERNPKSKYVSITQHYRMAPCSSSYTYGPSA